MTSADFSLATWSHALAAASYACLALYVLWRSPALGSSRKAWRVMVLALGCTAAWGALATGTSQGPGWLVLATLFDLGRYGAWFAFIVLLFAARSEAGAAAGAPTWMRVAAWALPLCTLILLLTPLPAARHWFFLSFMLMAVLGLLLLEQLLRNLPDDAIWSVKPIALGLGATFAFDLYLFSEGAMFRAIDTDVWSIRGLVHAAMVPLFWLASARHRDWIGKLQVSRTVVFHSASMLLIGLYLLFISSVGYLVRSLGSDWGRALQLALMATSLVLLVALGMSRSLRARLRVTLGKHLFRYRFDYREEWLKFTKTLSAQQDPQALGLNVVRAMADMVESPSGALWWRDAGEPRLLQVARWNTPEQPLHEPLDGALASYLIRTGWVIDVAEARSRPQRYEGLQLPAWLSTDPQAGLLVPLWVADELTGFVLLGRSRTPLDLNWEVTDLLKTAGRQAASYLAQMHATEALLEARKFEAFSRMSAFVVHDLKNIVTQLSLMMKNAKRLGHNPEFQADMLLTVENSLERMRQMILQLREGAAPGDGPVGVELVPLLEALAQQAVGRGRRVDLELVDKVAARGNPQRLERVLGHLVSNALEATDESQRVWLRLDRYGSHARVLVGDNGRGMSEAFVRQQLFKPFSTTKSAGMGIGAYESHQYVQELGGKLLVDSQEGEGTRITVLLPLMESGADSDLHRLEQA
jgi:putative PEP-CTERM system histidine kinase